MGLFEFLSTVGRTELLLPGPQEQKSVFALSLRLNILVMKSGDTDGERKKTDKSERNA